MSETAPLPIPQPPEKPLVGNALDLGATSQVQDLMELAREYGEIFYLSLGGRRFVVVSSAELVEELSDESRFDKRVWAPLHHVRAFAGDGLFTAHTFEPNWHKAHNILLPAFSMAAMKGYHPMMVDIARQLVLKWERANPHEAIDVTEDMTRLTLDTIGLCGFDYRFNSFYRDRPHPFIRAMNRALSIALGRSARPPLPQQFFYRENRRFRRAVDLMNQTVDGIIQERRASGEDLAERGDLLSKMLVGRDPDTDEGLDDVNIRYQIITFLIAGHETTSGLLSFALYFLTRHPEVRRKAQQEVDRVFGTDPERDPTFSETTQLRYVRQVLNEALRLWPTAPMFALFPKEGETLLGGRYRVDKRDGIAVLLPMLHRDPAVWGRDAESFDPEHFAPEAEAKRPVHAFKPFGNGQRACIGRQFAMHEAMLALGMILQRFELHASDDDRLEIQETLTLKPRGFELRVSPRQTSDQAPVEAKAASEAPAPVADTPRSTEVAEQAAAELGLAWHGTPLLVLFGSNMGTAETQARRIGDDAERSGFEATVAPLDDYADRLPTEGGVVIVSSSYNGQPPDNARRFVAWLESGELGERALEGVRYAVFGCGHRDWAATYQAVPTTLDRLLAAHGAERMAERGEGDGGGDFDGDFESWYRPFWRRVAEALDLELDESPAAEAAGADLFEVEVLEDDASRAFVEELGARTMVVVENRELQAPGSGRSTRHLELALPAGIRYRTGDHLGVFPQNDPALVRRALGLFGYDEQTRVRIHRRAPGRGILPLDRPVRAASLLRDYVELQDPATRSQIEVLARHVSCPPERERLLALCGDDDESRRRFREHVLEPRRSLLDLMSELGSCELGFAVWLGLLTPLRPRYYSISSSPRLYDRICSLTVAVVEGPARSGQGVYKGVCSSWLAAREKGSQIQAFVRDTGSAFRPPPDPETPMILIGPGTGVAPFRGFLQERAALIEEGRTVGPSILFFGCRHPEQDWLYREELERWARDGVVDLVTAFSRTQPEKVYVQHRLIEHGDAVWQLLERDAVVYVCGDASHMAPAVRASFVDLYRERARNDERAADRWLRGLEEEGRYRVDVWSSG